MSISDPKPGADKRSPEWSRVRAEWLQDHPACAVCGRTDAVEVHHIRPFHLHPELELDPGNLITLCEHTGEGNDHYCYGHLRSWQSFNDKVEIDAAAYLAELRSRP